MFRFFTVIFLIFTNFNLNFAFAKTIYVSNSGDNSNTGHSWEESFSSVQNALNNATSGDSIKIAEGEYYPEILLNPKDKRSAYLKLKDGVKLYGGYKINENFIEIDRKPKVYNSVITGDIGVKNDTSDNIYHLIYNDIENPLSSNTLIDGLTFSYASADGSDYGMNSKGGAIYLSENSRPVISGCVFKDNYANTGAGIYNDGNINLTINYCEFIDNKAIVGAGLFLTYRSTNLIQNSIFNNNIAKNGAGIYNSNSYTTIEGCQFHNNLSGFGSSIYNYNSEVSVKFSNFAENVAISHGGAVYNFVSETKYVSCDFSENTSQFAGGVISDYFNCKTVIEECDFRNNASIKNGGVYRGERGTTLDILSSDFTNNVTNLKGGAVYLTDNSTLNISNSTFDNNKADYLKEEKFGNTYGGAIAIEDSVKCKIYDSKFINKNSAQFGGAVSGNNFSTFDIQRSEFQENYSSLTGGGIYLFFCDINIKHCDFKSNSSSDDGGGFYSWTSTAKIDSCNFSKNKAVLGAGLLLERTESYVRDCDFRNNSGGGFLIVQCDPEVLNCNFVDNRTSNFYGAGIYSLETDTEIINCNFTGNSTGAMGRGGAVYNYDSKLLYKNCNFSNNAADYGGVAYSNKAITVFDSCVFEYNSAYTAGGAFCNWGDTCNITVLNSIVRNNKAIMGGAFYCSSFSTLTNVINSIVVKNESDLFGGAFYNRMYATVYIINCTISDNLTGRFGGGVYGIKSNTYVFNSIFWNNLALEYGNDFYNIDGSARLEYSCFANNVGDIYGDIQTYFNIHGDPQLLMEGDNYYSIYGSSPCVNRGNNNINDEPYDLRGNGFPRRANGSVIDMGAYEYQEGIDPAELALETPFLVAPLNTMKHIPLDVTFEWERVEKANLYEIVIAKDIDFSDIVDVGFTTSLTYQSDKLEKTNKYFWKVRALNAVDTSRWSLFRYFRTIGQGRYVNKIAEGENSGKSWKDAFLSFQSALDVAGYGDTIYVAEGKYIPSEKIVLTNEVDSERKRAFKMIKGVIIYGGFPAVGNPTIHDRDFNEYLTIFSGNIGLEDKNNDNCYHVFYNYPALNIDTTAVIDGCVIQEGYTALDGETADSFGAGIYNGDCNPIIRNCTFIDNHSVGGGGIINSQHEEYYRGGAKIEKCTFYNNTAQSGGGAIRNYRSGPRIDSCYFEKNNDAVYSIKSKISVKNSDFIDNSYGIYDVNSNSYVYNCVFNAQRYAIYDYYYSDVTVNKCRFFNNKFGTYQDRSECHIYNSLFDSNSTAIYIKESNNYFTNCTLVNNEIGIKQVNVMGFVSNAYGYNSIFLGNNQVFSNTIYLYNSCVNDLSPYDKVKIKGENFLEADPEFVSVENHNFMLRKTSPCINYGDNQYVTEEMTTDLNGDIRIVDDIIDLGAYEWNQSQDTVSVEESISDYVSIYPNPAQDYIQVNINNPSGGYEPSEGSMIEIYNVLGNRVLYSTPSLLRNTTPQEGNFKIDISHLQKGVYFLKIDKRVYKFIKL